MTRYPDAAADIEAGRMLLARLGLTPEQLLTAPVPLRTMPTIADYIDQVSEAVEPGTRRVYSTYWRRVADA